MHVENSDAVVSVITRDRYGCGYLSLHRLKNAEVCILSGSAASVSQRHTGSRHTGIMLFLMVSLLHWSQTEGGCSGAMVSILAGDDVVLSAGESFSLRCEFTCLTAQHVAQLWRSSPPEESVILVNITSILPNVSLVLSISSATEADTGYYSCLTQPPDTISPEVLIQIADNLTTSTLTTTSTSKCDGTKQQRRTASLRGQMWLWILLGKTAILLLSVASLAVKHR